MNGIMHSSSPSSFFLLFIRSGCTAYLLIYSYPYLSRQLASHPLRLQAYRHIYEGVEQWKTV